VDERESSTNVGLPIGRFVGRIRELEELTLALERDARLVTITGAAGIGKSRLAIELALRLVPRFARGGGVWSCPLAGVRDAERMSSVIAEILEVPPAGSAGAQGAAPIGRALAARGAILLVLDNFEQLIDDGAPALAQWLEHAPDLRVIVTSRERTRIDGELVYDLGPLEHAARSAEASPSERADAVEMLADRVARLAGRAGADGATVDEASLRAIAARLDGIPLAIELAAPRVAFLGAARFLERLHQRFALLGSPGQRATLRAALDSSWDLLDEVEQSALAQVSVFRGSFDLDAAEATLALPGSAPVLDALQALHEKSLLRIDRAGGEHRFSLLPTIAEYAAIRLEDLPDVAGAERGAARRALEARHAAWYASCGLTAARACAGPGAVAAHRALRLDRENLEAAATRGGAEDALAAALALEPVLASGALAALADLLVRAIGAAQEETPRRIEARIALASAWRYLGRVADAAAELERARDAAQARADVVLEGRAEAGIAVLALVRGRLPEARAGFERALALLSAAPEGAVLSGAPEGAVLYEASARSSYAAALAGLGELDRARAELERALSLHAALGNLREVGMISAYAANLCIDEGRLDEAREHLAQAMAIHDEIDDRFGRAFATSNLAIVLHRELQLDAARTEYRRCITDFREIGALRYHGAFTGYLGVLERERGAITESCELLARACELLTEARDERFAALFRAHLAAARAQIGEPDAAALLERARQAIVGIDDPYLATAIEAQAIAVEPAESAPGDRLARLDALAQERAQRSTDVLFSWRIARRSLGQPSAIGKPRTLPPDPWPVESLVIESTAAWFRPPHGARVSLERRDALRRILLELALARADSAGKVVPRARLIATGWPGERMIASAAGNRLRVAIATLRRLGLGDAIATHEGGYHLSADVSLLLWESER
jgi:predicted ATPase